jgi:hypothetical protein
MLKLVLVGKKSVVLKDWPNFKNHSAAHAVTHRNTHMYASDPRIEEWQVWPHSEALGEHLILSAWVTKGALRLETY